MDHVVPPRPEAVAGASPSTADRRCGRHRGSVPAFRRPVSPVPGHPGFAERRRPRTRTGSVHGRHHVHQQAFRPPVAETLDHQQHSQGPAGRPERHAVLNAHQAIVPARALTGRYAGVFPVRDTVTLPCRCERGPAFAGGEGDAFDGLVDSRGGRDAVGLGQTEAGEGADGACRAAWPPGLSPRSPLLDVASATCGRAATSSTRWPNGTSGPSTSRPPWDCLGPDRPAGHARHLHHHLLPDQGLGDSPGIPYPIFAFIGILSWTFFSQALGTGGTSLLTNHELMSKTQFPRECFPLETILVNAVNAVLAWIPLVVLFILLSLRPVPDDRVGAAPDR